MYIESAINYFGIALEHDDSERLSTSKQKPHSSKNDDTISQTTDSTRSYMIYNKYDLPIKQELAHISKLLEKVCLYLDFKRKFLVTWNMFFNLISVESFSFA